MSFFADSLKALLARRGLTEYRLARLAGVSDATIFDLASGRRRPSDTSLKVLVEVAELGVGMDELQAWRLIDEYPKAAIVEAIRLLLS